MAVVECAKYPKVPVRETKKIKLKSIYIYIYIYIYICVCVGAHTPESRELKNRGPRSNPRKNWGVTLHIPWNLLCPFLVTYFGPSMSLIFFFTGVPRGSSRSQHQSVKNVLRGGFIVDDHNFAFQRCLQCGASWTGSLRRGCKICLRH